MRLYGALSELASLVIRLASGKTVTVKSAEQQQQDIEVTIPDVGGSTQKEFLMVETTTAQPIKSKTINFAQNTVTPASLNINTLTAPSGVGNQVVRLNQSTGVIETGLITNANIDVGAAISDTKLAKITSANKVDSGAVQAVQGDNGRVLSFDANGAPSAALISNVNIAANALIAGSKITDLPASSLAQMSSADLAGRITDETGSGALVFGTGPTLTNASVSGYEDFNHTNTPGSNPTGAVRVYAKSDNKLYTLSPAGIEQAVGSGGSVLLIPKTGHGFLAADVGCPVYLNASGEYVKAKADAANTAEVAGLINKIVDLNNFEVCLGGEVESVGANAAATLVPGELYFLSPTTAGALTATEPSVVGQVSKPVGIARTSSKLDFFNMRGTVVGGANLRTQIGLNGAALVSQTTNIQNVTAYTAGELSGWVYIDATTDRRFYIQVQFVKDAANAWKASFQTTGDTPPAGFNVDVIVSGPDAFVQVQMPPVAGWSSGSINFALNAPAVGATLPLQIDSANVSFTDIKAASSAGITFKEDGGAAVGSVSDAGAWSFGPSSGFNGTHTAYGSEIKLSKAGSGLGFTIERTGASAQSWTIGQDSSGPGGTNGIYFYDNTGAKYAGGVSTDGAWTLGPSGYAGSHTINGATKVNNIVATSNGSSIFVNLIPVNNQGFALICVIQYGTIGWGNRFLIVTWTGTTVTSTNLHSQISAGFTMNTEFQISGGYLQVRNNLGYSGSTLWHITGGYNTVT